jgi:DNA polymerase zeta
MGRKFQPFDAHIPYHLQFMIDYNLYGMNLVHYGAVKFRHTLLESVNCVSPVSSSSLGGRNSISSSSGVKTVWNLSQLPHCMFSNFLEKVTVTELEIDVCVTDIIVSGARSGNFYNVLFKNIV